MPTSVVTGGAGFLGSHLCDYLLAHSHRVICVDNLETGSLENIEHLREDAFSFVYQDVVEGIWIDESVDYVFHLASPASPIDYLRLPLQTLKVGSQGTHNALGLAQACIRVTNSSSEIVFEALPVDDPMVRRPDITRARQILGWEPEVDLDEGLRRWIASLGRDPV